MSKYRKQKSKASNKGFMSRQTPEKSLNPRGQSSKLKNLEEIIQNYNSGVQYYQSGKLQEAELCFQQVVKCQPDRLDAWQLLGRIAVEQKQYTKAIERMERVIKLNPDYPGTHNNLGNVLKKQGKLEEAIASYRHALQLQPDYPDAQYNLGNALQEQGQLEEAISYYQDALNLKPDYHKAHNHLGNALKEKGQLEEAIASYQCALKLKPDYSEAHYSLGNALQEQGQLEEAIASYQRALQFNPDYPGTHNNLGNVLKIQGQLEEAISFYQRALQLKPDYPDVHNNLGNALQEQGQLEEAISFYQRALQLKPDYPDVHNNLGNALQKQGKLEEAISHYQDALNLKPDYSEAHYSLGNALQEQGQLEEAIASYQSALQFNPDYPGAHNNLGNVLKIQGQLEKAISSYQRALQLDPNYPDVHNNLGNVLQEQGQSEEAIASYQRALQLKPDYPDGHNNLGNALQKQGQLEEAISHYQHALNLKPNYSEAHYNLGNALKAQGKLDEAIASYQRALQFNPDYPDVHNNLGNTLQEQGQLEEAIASYQRALQLKPDYPDGHNNLGNVLKIQGKLEEAISSYQHALQLDPNYPDVHNNLGNALLAQGKSEEAIASYQRALQLKPDYPDGHNNLGNALQKQGQLKAALTSYEVALQLKHDHQLALQQYVWVGRLICDWDNLNCHEQSSLASVQSGQSTFPPFVILAVTDDPAIQLAASRNYWNHKIGNSLSPLWTGQRYSHDKIRLAYLSADFHQHATSYLMAELFELHDRSKFELFAISFGPGDTGPMRQRLVDAFDRFIDVRELSHLEAAQQIRDLEIDIAVDLKGYTKDSRPQILAHRPAPIQVNYLGYPSTMGTDCIDYILVDPFIAPTNQQPHFTEKLVHLPECYQVNDRQRPIAEHIPSRKDCGLPTQGFVFCSFNNSYKITPTVFDIWMRLLSAVPGSVLWLLGSNSSMEGNLRREAQARGVNPDRLIFAPKLTLSEHLARHRLADLFLDNFPCNAHTTTSDALWAGLPVLTCAGRSFASRVAGSLLNAIGLPELVTDNLEEYEALALKLATEPERLQQIKQKLQQNRLTSPLFDCDRFRQHIEAAYTQMWSVWQSGEEPKAFAVKAEVESSPVEVPLTAKPNIFLHSENESKSTILKQENSKTKATPNFMFTITPGHTGTTFLASLLKINIYPSQIYHEILGYDKFGVDTPDVSHLTLFNSQGNIEKIREFWRHKFDRIIANKTCSFYGETSHMLAKAGLMENIEILCKHGDVKIVCLKRDTFKVVNSLAKRFDFLNKGNMWLWHLDPNYPRKIVDPKPFVTYGINGIRLWYVYEMYARAEYYKSIYSNNPRLSFIDIDISDLSSPENVQAFLAALGVPCDRENVKFPERKNVSNRAVNKEMVDQIKGLVGRISFDPLQLANEFINQGQKL